MIRNMEKITQPQKAGLDLGAAFTEIIELINSGWDDAWLITGPRLREDPAAVHPNPPYGKVDQVHHHEFTEICAGIQGECRLNIRGEKYTLNRGRLAFIVPAAPHMEISDTGNDYLVAWISVHITKIIIHFSGKNTSGELYTVQGCTLAEDDSVNSVNAGIISELNRRRSGYETMVRAMVLQLLIFISRLIDEHGADRENTDDWKLRTVIGIQKYIEMNYQSHLTLADISREMCISMNYLNTIFKTVTGTTIMQYAQQVKISAAKTLLRSKEKSIKDIAESLGYYDQYHFSKVFKKEIGCAPSEYRRTYSKY